jgi:hypothetical protein
MLSSSILKKRRKLGQASGASGPPASARPSARERRAAARERRAIARERAASARQMALFSREQLAASKPRQVLTVQLELALFAPMGGSPVVAQWERATLVSVRGGENETR